VPYRIPDDVLHRQVDNDTVILDSASSSYVALNTTAGRMWELFGLGRTVDEVIATIIDEFEVDPETIAADVPDMLEQFLAKGLLEPNP
jgi:hypothetical protein